MLSQVESVWGQVDTQGMHQSPEFQFDGTEHDHKAHDFDATCGGPTTTAYEADKYQKNG